LAEIRPLVDITTEDVQRLIVGYSSRQRYDVIWSEGADRTSFELTLVDLPEPFEKTWRYDDDMTAWFRGLFSEGLSFGAWHDDVLIGIAITERRWNDELMVWEIHVDHVHRGQGVGRQLLTAVEAAAKARDDIRGIAIETQTPNVAAISFYRACGYSLQALDLRFYENDDLERGEVAVFMKKAIR
jgi:ribosomal protein S18 acetylase RimI-like enzyme